MPLWRVRATFWFHTQLAFHFEIGRSNQSGRERPTKKTLPETSICCEVESDSGKLYKNGVTLIKSGLSIDKTTKRLCIGCRGYKNHYPLKTQ